MTSASAPPDGPHRLRKTALAVRLTEGLVLVVALAAAVPLSAGDVVPGETSTSLRCGLQALPASPPAEITVNGFPAAVRTRVDRSEFRHHEEGDWILPESVDTDDPVVPCLLLLPKRPMRVDISITVAGQPFRTVREHWIDEAFAVGKPSEKLSTDETPPENPPAAEAVLSSKDNSEPADDSLEPGAAQSAPAAFRAASPRAWLARYFGAAEEPFDRDEARWILAHRAGGPCLLELSGFATPRSFLAPLMHTLDRNNDASLAADELAGVEAKLSACDQDQNDLVGVEELPAGGSRRAAGGQYIPLRANPRIFVLDDTCDPEELRASLAGRYPELSKKGSEVGEFLPRWRAAPADFAMQVAFRAEDGVSPVRGSKSAEDIQLHATDDSLVAMLDGTWIEFSAWEPSATTTTELSQASIGLSVEGAPLWNLVDKNQDGALSRRERGQATELLRSLDRDGDGAVARDEIPTWIRVAVCWGPGVTQMLTPQRPSPVRLRKPEGNDRPAWFMSMDANGDGDLSRDEFLGDPAQFDQLDTDGDRLISPAETTSL